MQFKPELRVICILCVVCVMSITSPMPRTVPSSQKARQKYLMEIQIEQSLCNDDFSAQIFLEDFFWNLKLI